MYAGGSHTTDQPVVSEAVPGRSSSRGRGHQQGRGRGRGRGRGARTSHRQQPALSEAGADHQLAQLTATASAGVEHTSAEQRHHRSNGDRLTVSRGTSSQRQQNLQGQVLHMQEERLQQARQRLRGHSKHRQAGPRNSHGHHRAAVPTDAAAQTQDGNLNASGLTDCSQDVPDCVICCEPMQVCIVVVYCCMYLFHK